MEKIPYEDMSRDELIRELRESPATRYSDLFEFAPFGYCTIDAHGLIREINLTGAALLRASREYLIDKPIASLVAKDDRVAIRTHLERCAEHRGRVTTEVRFSIEGRGAALVAQLVSSPHRDAAPARYRTALVDITAHKQFAERLCFLTQVGDRLAWSLDDAKILAAVASLTVPFLADACLVDMLDDGRMRRPEHVLSVLRSGEPLLVADASEATLHDAAPDEEQARMIRSAGRMSMMVTPLRVGGAVIGALTFLAPSAERRCSGEATWPSPQEIARRASMAMGQRQRLHEAGPGAPSRRGKTCWRSSRTTCETPSTWS